MRTVAAAIGSLIFFVVAPGLVAYVIPYLIGSALPGAWRLDPPVDAWIGVALGVLGTVALIECFVRFVIKGVGTPAPVAPTENLVVTGLYRHVRNPMYVAVVAIIVAQGLWFASLAVLGYAVLVWAAFTVFVAAYEEPRLAADYGEQYERYRRNVRRWIPRLSPWRS